MNISCSQLSINQVQIRYVQFEKKKNDKYDRAGWRERFFTKFEHFFFLLF